MNRLLKDPPLLSIRSPAALLLALAVLAACASCNRDRNSTETPPAAATALSASGEASLAAGMPAPPLALTALDGRPITLESFRGKTVLLNFWATWCSPCVAEMPSLQRLYQKYREQGLEVVAVAVDRKEPVQAFVDKNGITFPVVLTASLDIPQGFGITAFPESFFIGPDGNFLAFLDPATGNRQVRIISDRPWDSQVFLKAIEGVLSAQNG